jgi:hypothetical protein
VRLRLAALLFKSFPLQVRGQSRPLPTSSSLNAGALAVAAVAALRRVIILTLVLAAGPAAAAAVI